MNATDYAVVAIDPEVADDLRRRGGTVRVADVSPGFPCRQCLRDADVGEELLLVSHDPFLGDSPYRSASPIYLHREPCPPAPPSSTVPVQLSSRVLSVRAFGADAMMIDAEVVDGVELDPTIRRFLLDPQVHHLHVHNAKPGCWAARVDRLT